MEFTLKPTKIDLKYDQFYCIGDVQGEYHTLLKLVEKLDKSIPIIFMGDLVDRGPRSIEVLRFVLNNHSSLLGNHELMMVAWLLNYNIGTHYGCWLYNGGIETISSITQLNDEEIGILRKMSENFAYDTGLRIDQEEFITVQNLKNKIVELIQPELEQLMKLPVMILKKNEVILTHAPIYCKDYDKMINEAFYLSDNTILWNKSNFPPTLPELSIYGHMSDKNVRKYSRNGRTHAICIDTMGRGNKLTAIHYPSLDIIEQEYIF